MPSNRDPASESAGVSRGRPLADSGASTTEDRKVPRCPSYPHYHIPKWYKYQKNDVHRFFRVESSINTNPAIAALTNADLGLLLRIWAATALLDEWLPQDTTRLLPVLSQTRSRHVLGSLKRLESRGMLTTDCLTEESRGERVERIEKKEKSTGIEPVVLFPLGDADAAFAEWWEIFRGAIHPRTMRNKDDCLKLWRKIVKTPEHSVNLRKQLAAQDEYRQDMAEQKKFVQPLQDPIRYLKNKGWKEEF